jgi:hypothetical protein
VWARALCLDAQDFENAAVLRDRERQLLGDKAAREQERAAPPSLTGEIDRLRDLGCLCYGGRLIPGGVGWTTLIKQEVSAGRH